MIQLISDFPKKPLLNLQLFKRKKKLELKNLRFLMKISSNRKFIIIPSKNKNKMTKNLFILNHKKKVNFKRVQKIKVHLEIKFQK